MPNTRMRKRPRTSYDVNGVAVHHLQHGCRRGYRIETLWEATTVDPPDDPDIMTRELDARSWAVRQLWAAADLTSAIDLGCRVAADSQRVLGAEHPTTLDARHDLAVAYASARLRLNAMPGRELPQRERKLLPRRRAATRLGLHWLSWLPHSRGDPHGSVAGVEFDGQGGWSAHPG